MRTVLLSMLCTVAPAALAQSALVTDRPDFTESGVTVPAGSVQIESGYTYTAEGDVDVVSGPELLVRWSPAERIEARIGVPDHLLVDGEGAVADPSVGAKVQIGPVAGWDLGVILSTSLPLGDDTAGAPGAEPSLLVTTGRGFGRWSVGTQAEAGWDSAAEEALFGGTLVAGAELSDRVGAFAEVFLQQQSVGAAAVLLHGGLTFSPVPLVQLDVHGGLGLTDTAPDVLVGVGLSLRR